MVASCVLAVAALFASTAAQAQATGRVITGYPAGGVIDILTRIVSDGLREQLGQNFIAENRAGGAGRIALDAVRTATPDGNTLLVSPIANICIFPHTHDNLGYDAIRDLAPVALVAGFDIALAIGPGTPARNLEEFVAWGKANPKLVSFGTPGPGNLPHFFGLLFGKAVGIEMTNVPYKGSPPAISDLVGGQIPIVVTVLGDFIGQARAGKIRVLAHSGATRAKSLPDVPTFKEIGIAGLEGGGWYGFFAPAKTPAATIERLNAAVVKTLATPAVSARIESLSLHAQATTPASFTKMVHDDYERWGKVIRASGFKATD